MRESYSEEPATHAGPESCVSAREGRGEALTGVRIGRVSSLEIGAPGRPTSYGVRKATWMRAKRAFTRQASAHPLPRGLRPRACAESPRAGTGRSHGRLQRPLGIPTMEDKLVQGITKRVLDQIYELEFLGFSYGFRPGRGAHRALDALTIAIERKKVSWVLDADIRGFFDAIDHDCLMTMIERRIGAQRVLRHIKKWLNAGVLEDGKKTQAEYGTPQGGSTSPLLANIYLHYAFDLWVTEWRRTEARGEVSVVRYADDCAPRRRERKPEMAT